LVNKTILNMNKGKFSCKLGELEINGCISNASGPRCTDLDELKEIDKSHSGLVLSKSATLEFREGNPKPRYRDNEWGSINSMGLPNNGIDYYLGLTSQIEKPYFISVNGLTYEDTLEIISKIMNRSEFIQGIEINLSCPNIVGKGQIAYDTSMMRKYLNGIFEKMSHNRCDFAIGVKLPPYFDFSQFEDSAKVLMEYPLDFITCINSIGNGLIIDGENESAIIKPKNGFGGIGGKYIKPTGLANVRKFYEIFKSYGSKIKIIGCGGIENGMDAFEYILCGAEMVQIGTQYYKEGKKCFKRIERELAEIMERKGYTNLSEFRGKLKTI
jgi:dihydroorotate dehydrogenase (fumarate)